MRRTKYRSNMSTATVCTGSRYFLVHTIAICLLLNYVPKVYTFGHIDMRYACIGACMQFSRLHLQCLLEVNSKARSKLEKYLYDTSNVLYHTSILSPGFAREVKRILQISRGGRF